METVLSNMNPMKVLFFLCKSATCFVMEEFYVGVGAGCKVAHSFSFLSLGYSLVALVPSDFLIKVSFLFKLISLRLSKAGMHNIDVFMMWNILMSYILSLSDQMLFAPAIITLLCFFSKLGKMLCNTF